MMRWLIIAVISLVFLGPLAGLFAEMVEDLLAQIELVGDGLREVTVDGVLRRSEGGLRAWGYVSGDLRGARSVAVPVVTGQPVAIVDETGQVSLSIRLARP